MKIIAPIISIANHKTSATKIAKQLKTEDGYVLTVPIKEKTRQVRIVRLKDLRDPTSRNALVDQHPKMYLWTLSRTELIKRLNSQQCE